MIMPPPRSSLTLFALQPPDRRVGERRFLSLFFGAKQQEPQESESGHDSHDSQRGWASAG